MKDTTQPTNLRYHLTLAASLLIITLLSSVMSLSFIRGNPDHFLIFDDSYITLRFAANVFQFGGITYDGSSFIAGATSPLHIVLVALFGLLFEREVASLAVGILFFVSSSVLVCLWTFKIYGNKYTALLAGVMASTTGWLVFDSLNGLETTTFIFFSLLTFYLFYSRGSRPFYLIPLVLSILTRPEGWFIANALWFWQLIEYYINRDKQLLRNFFGAIGLFAVLIIPYLLCSLYYTASLLPGTALAKATFFAEGGMPLVNKIGCFKNGLLLFFNTLLYSAPLFILPLIFCARRVIALPYLWLYYSIFSIFYFLFFPCALKHYWCRYQHIFIPMIIVAIAGGTHEVLTKCRKRWLRSVVFVVILSSIGYNQTMSVLRVRETYSCEIDSTRDTLVRLARWIKRNTPENALIAVHDIGAVGYFSDRKILDLVGLTNPEVGKCYWDTEAKHPVPFSKRNTIDYLKGVRPDYLVMFPEWDRFLNILSPGNNYFTLVYTTLPLYPTGLKYHVFKCSWDRR